MTQNKLPKYWKVVKLGEICDKMSNGANAKQFDDQIGLPISRIETIWNETIDLKRVKYIYENEESFIDKYALKKNDILFSHINSDIHLGKTALYKNQTKTLIHGINLLLIRLIEEAHPDFFNYQFNYKRRKGEFITIAHKSVNQSSINQPKLKNIDFVLPPLETQTLIVSKIEELFSELDKGIEDLKTAQQQLKTYRQSVLKYAFEGKLTNKKVKDGVLPKGWKAVNIEDIAKVGTGATPLKGNKNYYENGKIAWVTSGALNDEFVREATDYVTELALKETNLSLYPKHTLLLAMYGEGKTRGKCSELLIEASTNQAIAAISFENHDIRVKPLLKYFLLKNYNDIRMLSSGGVQPNLNLGIVKKTQLPFPPLEEQHQIVQEIESRLSVADKMEESITQSLLQAEALRQSILKKAFSGELV